MVRALFVQLKNQFSRKRISADFIVLWPTRKWKKNQLSVAYFLFPFGGKKKNRIQKRAFLLPFSKENKEQIQTDAFLFPFSEGNKKGILYHAFIFSLSEESTEGIQNDGFLFPFFGIFRSLTLWCQTDLDYSNVIATERKKEISPPPNLIFHFLVGQWPMKSAKIHFLENWFFFSWTKSARTLRLHILQRRE